MDMLDHTLLDDMTWDSDDSRSLTLSILDNRYVYIKQLAVRKGYQHQGVARFLYTELEREVGCPIVVFAAIKPKRNEPSVQFHETMGYQRVSRLYRATFGEFTDYESLFYVKLNHVF